MESRGAAPVPRGRIRPRRVLFLLLVVLLLGMVGWFGRLAWTWYGGMHRTTPVYDPPVLAGYRVSQWCGGGIYARTADDTIVLTSTGHCSPGGDPMFTADDHRFVGIIGPPSNWPTCDRPGKDRCTSSDMALVAVIPAMLPWGHLNELDLGAGGYRTIEPGDRLLACPDVHTGDRVELNGRGWYRTGTVIGQQANDFAADGTYFPCISVADIDVGGGDSGTLVLVNGQPAGVASRAYHGKLGFTPLAEGLAELGLTACDTPDCGLTPEMAANRLLSNEAP
jgi:hypothetical protein